MVSTLQLSALVHQAQDAGAKILLVGDPAQLDAIDAGGVLGWLDRLGKATRLSTIWRFEHDWERGASLKLRSGDYSALADYDQHGRLRHGSYPDMVDQAYSAWQSDIQSGKSSILIAPDNDTVSMLNERAQADLVVQGAVDAEQTVLLSDGLHAGVGDTIIARRNDRSITDSNGDFIRNGTLLDVDRALRHDGSLIAVRRDTGGTITLPGAYVEASIELGYATTGHRSQGITVDTGHTVLTQGSFTRELLYVSMTRGRSSNCAYVSERDPAQHSALDPSLHPSWHEILGEVLAAEGAERTAHEVREAELTKADSLERLSAEYDYLAQVAAAEDLTRVIQLHPVGSVIALEQSPSWGAAVAAWRMSSAIARPTAERLVLEAVKTCTQTTDIVAVLQSRLRHSIDRMPAGLPDPLTEPLHSSRSDLDQMISEVRERMLRRMTTITTSALIQDDEWKQNLLNSLAPETPPVEANRVVSSVAVFRDRWGIGDSPLPLGPIPSEYEWEQKAQRMDLESEIHRSTLHSPIDPPGWAYNPTRHLDVLTPAGWQL